MGKQKTKAIQTDLSTFRHNQAYPGIIQVTMEYLEPGISRTLTWSEPEAYSEPWHIHNPAIFRALGYSKSEIYSGTCQTSSMGAFCKNYNYFHQEFLQIMHVAHD